MSIQRFQKKVLLLILIFILSVSELLAVSATNVVNQPLPLQLLKPVVGTSTITLTWSEPRPVTGTVDYSLFRNGVRVAKNIRTRTYADKNLKPSTKYSYVVKSVDKSGRSLRSSQALHVTTSSVPDRQAPTIPQNLTVNVVTEQSLVLTWSPSSDNVKVSGYEVFRNGNSIAKITASSFADGKLQADTVYRYSVRAFDGAKNGSAQSKELSVKTKSTVVEPKPKQSLFPQMYIRGTFNNFGTSQKMSLVNDYVWQATVKFFGQTNDRFKFDVYGDWRENYGDDNGDFVAEVGDTKSIPVKNGAGEYTITFDEKTLLYTITPPGITPPVDPPTPPVPPTTNPTIKLDYATYNLQVGQIDYLHATVQGAGATPKLIWTSDNPNVLNVKNETMKAVAPGTAIVKVALADNPSVFDQSTVTVVEDTRHPVYRDPDLNYVFDMTALPEITIQISTVEWNKLLTNYDANPQNEIEVMADFKFEKDGVVDELPQIGIRLRGNTSRRRPEGIEGQLHNAFNPQWNHAHFALKFSKFNKSQRFRGMSDMNTKWFKDDAMYAREVFSYDLQRRSDVWTAPFSSYAKLTIKIKEDAKPAFFGVYQMIEAINQDYLNKRFPKNALGVAPGNLWKGTYPGSTGPADLQPRNLDDKIGIEDPDNDIFKSYDLKTNKKTIDTMARPQLETFMEELSSSAANKQWLEQRIDVDLFLKYLAASVAVGSWDDYWVLGNNYYMYFDESGKMHWIPYDFDNTLGTSSVIKDAGKQDVLRWGPFNSSRPLIHKLLSVPEFRAKYVQNLNELLEPQKNLFDERKSVARIKAWHQLVANHVKNDTGEDMLIADKPASWGNASYYRLFSGDEYTNFFKAKAAAIRKAKP